jgi:hypothetical protein
MAITYEKSHVMMCEYECIAPQSGQYFWGADGLQFKRKAEKIHAHKATGHKTRSNHWGLQSVSPQDEQRRLSLPLYNPTQIPLQDSTGSFVGDWTAYNAATRGT